ncbi:MAG: HU family DNA-binding protein, partial [Candidatus Zixiibacteriota bacterium]
MTKADLVERVAEKTGLTRTDVAVVVDSFLDTVKKSLETG